MNAVVPLLIRTAEPFLWSVFMLSSAGNAADGGQQSEVGRYDCATMALHSLFAVEGRPISVGAVGRLLPARDPRGYSMV